MGIWIDTQVGSIMGIAVRTKAGMVDLRPRIQRWETAMCTWAKRALSSQAALKFPTYRGTLPTPSVARIKAPPQAKGNTTTRFEAKTQGADSVRWRRFTFQTPSRTAKDIRCASKDISTQTTCSCQSPVLYFFDIINGMANHHIWNGFTVPTEPRMCSEHTRLKPKYMPNLKDICGVVLDEFRDSDEGPSESTLLADDSCELVAGTRQSEMPFLRINVGFTAAVYKSTQGETDDKYAIFGVVSVTSLLNVDSLRLILVSFTQIHCLLIKRESSN